MGTSLVENFVNISLKDKAQEHEESAAALHPDLTVSSTPPLSSGRFYDLMAITEVLNDPQSSSDLKQKCVKKLEDIVTISLPLNRHSGGNG